MNKNQSNDQILDQHQYAYNLPAKSVAAINNKVFIVNGVGLFEFIQVTCSRLNSWSWMFDSPTLLSIYRDTLYL